MTWPWKSCPVISTISYWSQKSALFRVGGDTLGHKSQDVRILEAIWRPAATCHPTPDPHPSWTSPSVGWSAGHSKSYPWMLSLSVKVTPVMCCPFRPAVLFSYQLLLLTLPLVTFTVL